MREPTLTWLDRVSTVLDLVAVALSVGCLVALHTDRLDLVVPLASWLVVANVASRALTLVVRRQRRAAGT